MPARVGLAEAFSRGVAAAQALLPSQRALAPSQAAGAMWVALGLLTALLYVGASATLGAFTARAPRRPAAAAASSWLRGAAGTFVRSYAQASFAALSVALLLEAPQHVLRAGAALAAERAAPPPRLVWTWTVALFCVCNDLLLALLGAVRPLARLAALVAPPAMRRSGGFALSEALGELGAAADLLVPRLGIAGMCLLLAALGRK